MEVSAATTEDFFPKLENCETIQEIVPYSSEKGPSHSARAGLLKRRKSLDKDALLAVKLDPAVLEAQVTLTKDEDPWHDRPALVTEIKTRDERCYPSFEEVLSMQQAALLGLTPQQLVLLMAFVDTLRRQRSQKHMECAFCKNNGAPASWYSSHVLRDRRRVRCPVLRALRCPRCGATGDHAHTPKYCPENLFSDEVYDIYMLKPRKLKTPVQIWPRTPEGLVTYGLLAQSVVTLPTKQEVPGSNPDSWSCP